jgi:diguanylate cyclase (GGDEF)-like protein
MMNIIEYLSRKSKTLLFALCLVLVILLGVIDYLTGPDFSFFMFYLIPVFGAAWFIGIWAGIAISTASAISWITAYSMATSFSYSFSTYWDMAMRLVLFLLFSYIFTKMKNIAIKLDREKMLARTDYLTDVANRRYFFELANIEIERAYRYKHPFNVIYIDIDRFKAINDTFGHTVGDSILRSVGRTIKNISRSSDIVARVGGDEFVILLPESDHQSVKIVINKIQGKLSEMAQHNEWPITFSFGVATFVSTPGSVDEMVKKADDLMYSAKNAGGNLVRHEVFGNTKICKEGK